MKPLRIIYVGAHDSGGGDDEGSVHHALESLGHDVQRVREKMGHRAHNLKGDLCLIHKWDATKHLKMMDMPRVAWYPDLVEYPDPTLEARNATRREWMARTLPALDMCFATDGDWVARDRTGKLVWLTQGADQRKLGFGKVPEEDEPYHFALMTGTRRGGRGRLAFVEEMTRRWGGGFHLIEKGVYGRELADLIAASRVVVAPNHPITPRYASNRVFTVLGYGGFLLHPRCAFLEGMYEDGKEIVYYDDMEDLHEKIYRYTAMTALRLLIAKAGLERTRKEHTYQHRTEALIGIVRERLRI